MRAEIFVESFPACFLIVNCHLNNGKIIELSTGSGDITKYLKKIMPVLDLWGVDLFGIK